MFGGMTISLILPKLIRSVARDGILYFLLGTATRRTIFHLTTQGKPVVFNDQLAASATECPTSLNYYPNYPAFSGMKRGDGNTPPPQTGRIT
jgi:hypothetical protein